MSKLNQTLVSVLLILCITVVVSKMTTSIPNTDYPEYPISERSILPEPVQCTRQISKQELDLKLKTYLETTKAYSEALSKMDTVSTTIYVPKIN